MVHTTCSCVIKNLPKARTDTRNMSFSRPRNTTLLHLLIKATNTRLSSTPSHRSTQENLQVASCRIRTRLLLRRSTKATTKVEKTNMKKKDMKMSMKKTETRVFFFSHQTEFNFSIVRNTKTNDNLVKIIKVIILDFYLQLFKSKKTKLNDIEDLLSTDGDTILN